MFPLPPLDEITVLMIMSSFNLPVRVSVSSISSRPVTVGPRSTSGYTIKIWSLISEFRREVPYVL